MLNRFYDDLETSRGQHGQGLSAQSVANIHGLVRKALSDAVKRGLVARNVADADEKPSAPKPITPDPWATDELRRFLDRVRDDRVYAGWLLFATTGMRRGEVAGLAWEDLDVDAGRLRVTRTLGDVDNKPTWKRPKTDAGARTMALDPATVDALRTPRANQAAERLWAGPAWQARQEDWRGESRTELVFTWPDGSLIQPERWTVWFVRHCKDAKLRRIRLPTCATPTRRRLSRHARGSHELKVSSERLGHASVAITMDTYSHVLPAADDETAHTLARLILGTGT